MKIFNLFLCFILFTAITCAQSVYYSLMGKGDQLSSEGKYKEAIKQFQAAINVDKSLPNAYIGIGYCYRRMNDNISALRYFYLALNHSETGSIYEYFSHFDLSDTYLSSEKPDSSLVHLRTLYSQRKNNSIKGQIKRAQLMKDKMQKGFRIMKDVSDGSGFEDREAIYFYNWSKVKKVKPNIYSAWICTVYKSSIPDEEYSLDNDDSCTETFEEIISSSQYEYSVVLREFNCSDETSAKVQSTYYNKDGSVDSDKSFNSRGSFSPVVPGSIGEGMLKFICSLKK